MGLKALRWWEYKDWWEWDTLRSPGFRETQREKVMYLVFPSCCFAFALFFSVFQIQPRVL